MISKSSVITSDQAKRLRELGVRKKAKNKWMKYSFEDSEEYKLNLDTYYRISEEYYAYTAEELMLILMENSISIHIYANNGGFEFYDVPPILGDTIAIALCNKLISEINKGTINDTTYT